MAAGILSFTGLLSIRKNSDFNFTLVCTDATTGNPINFTGYTAKMSIGVYSVSDPDCPSTPVLTIIYTLNSTGMNPNIIFDDSAGTIQLYIPVATTATLPTANDGLYDLLLYPPDDSAGTETFIQGPIQILPGITVP
jgi:hypothetical protein